MKLRGIITASTTLVLLAGCSSTGGGKPSTAPPSSLGCDATCQSIQADNAAADATIAAEPTPELTEVVVPDSPVDTAPAQAFPHGYPKVVKVSTLPDQVRSWYQMGHYKKAVAIAPGVWTPLSPGSTMQDAVATMVLDGFCASIKAYERKYLDGEEEGGTCW